MAQNDTTLDREMAKAAAREGGKRLGWWLIGGGFAVVGPFLIIIITSVAGLGLLAGAGHWLASFFGPTPPAIATPTSRPTEWLNPVTTDSEIDQGIPNTIVMAVINQASDGQVYGDRYYCSNGQTTGEACSAAYPPTKAHIGPRGIHILASPGAHNLGIGYGLMGLNGKDITLPANARWHSVLWNLDEGIGQLADYLRGQQYWQTALAAFHATVQTPPGWSGSGNYADTIKGLVGRYNAGPTLGAWALAPWSSKTGQFQDPGNAPAWVFVIGAAPTGAPFSHTWRKPTIIQHYDPQTDKHWTTIQNHILTGHDLASPVLVVGRLKNGQIVTFDLSTQNANIPVWQGGTVFGARIPLSGPQSLISITAYWPRNGLSDTMQWPEQSSGAVSTVNRVPPTHAVQTWWADIQVASHKTGVPADWIAAEMLNESGGSVNAGQNGLAGAYGLMQLEPATARSLPGWYPGARSNPQENLILGAELLEENYSQFGRWRIASAAYYGGANSVQNDGVTPGMPWNVAGPKLANVPVASAGNSLTMEEYADNIEATSQAVATMKNK